MNNPVTIRFEDKQIVVPRSELIEIAATTKCENDTVKFLTVLLGGTSFLTQIQRLTTLPMMQRLELTSDWIKLEAFLVKGEL